MPAKRIIPCLDIKEGQTVKGVRFKNIHNVGDPAELGALYSQFGADELVYLDITATNEKRQTLPALVERIAKTLNIPFTVGGGINNVKDAEMLLNAGADKIAVNSGAVKKPELINDLAENFGSQFVVLAIDAKKHENQWQVYTGGGRIATGIDLFEWAKEGQKRGCGEILFTSMDHDGTKDGFAIEPLSILNEVLSIPLIASGGAGKIEHFREVFEKANVDAALAASIFHFKEISIPVLKKNLGEANIEVRI